MFNYDVLCILCGKNKVYEVSFKEELSKEDLEIKKSGGVCVKCAPGYQKSMEEKKKLIQAKGPFFKLKVGG